MESKLLKDRFYTVDFFDRFSGVLSRMVSGFEKDKFYEALFVGGWQEMALKEKMRQTALALHVCLPEDFVRASLILKEVTAYFLENPVEGGGFEFMSLPDYIELYGMDDYESSVSSMEAITQLASCEFAVRPFLVRYGERMITQMEAWSQHENEHVRRLASEGMRPRLPWAMGLPEFKKDPSPVLPILENLKNDPSESVRRSVANNLNDISKDNPDVVLEVVNRWKSAGGRTPELIKHACRTLLKQGHPAILDYYGLDHGEVEVAHFRVETPEVPMGGRMRFSFSVKNRSSSVQVIRLEYGLYYFRKNGSHSRKVFKISERSYSPGEAVSVFRHQSFEPITTRRFYAGWHKVSVIANGREMDIADFMLTEQDG